jgi:hypothetical protein
MKATTTLRPRLAGAAAAIVVSLFAVVHSIAPRAQAQPSVTGAWSSVMNWPIVAVHMHLLPTGKILLWPYNDDPRIYDPANGSVTLAAKVGENPFCAGHSFLEDGRLFMAGGHNRRNGIGINSAYIYNPTSGAWTQLPDMNNNRWYPSCTTLANGDVLVTSGSYDQNYSNNDLPQVFQIASGTWRNLNSAVLAMTLYPRQFLAPNGKVFFATQTSRYLDTSGAGAWTVVGNQVVGGRENYGSAAMYNIGKIIMSGGGDPPVASAETIDLNQANPQWQLTGPMAGPRRQNNMTCLPDGTVLCTGGSASAGFNTEDGPKTAQLWNPATGTWTTMALEAEYRGYHSTALLLPDGRVLSAGGDNHPTAQIFSPPYLFAGARPTIASSPATASYGATITVSTPDAASITKVAITALGSLTHAQNWNERYVPLSFTSAGGSLNVTIPASPSIVPPGPYLLWIVNNGGVPAVAPFIRVSGFSSPPSAPTGLAAAGAVGQVNLSWNAANLATGYNVKRSTTSGGPYATIAPNVAGTSYSDAAVTGGTTYHYVVSGVNSAGEGANSSQASATPIAPPPPGTGTGLKGQYYNNIDFTALKKTRTDATVNFDWANGSPVAGMGADTFSVRWTGEVQAQFNETYTFYTVTDDGVRLWVNGQLIIDKWFDQGATEWSGTIVLAAGQRYAIQMDYYENAGGASARLLWSSPSQTKQVVPQTQLYPAP